MGRHSIKYPICGNTGSLAAIQAIFMQTFKALISELDSVLKTYNPVEYKKLQPPLPDDCVNKYLNEINITDQCFKALFQWKNGEEDSSYCQMTSDGGLQSLETIMQSKMFDKPYADSFIEVLSDNGEQSVLFNNRPGKHYGQLYFYSIGLYMKYPISYYDSLETMIQTIIKAYTTGAYEYNNEKQFLNVNFDSFSLIAKQFNKSSIFWKAHNPLKWEDWYDI